jgi:ADP-heptose:LPS heptosyltransferase
VIAIEQSLNLGDVISCLPMAALLKRRYPRARILFIARQYVRPLLEACSDVDGFLDAEQVLADPQLLRREGVDVFLSPYLHDPYGAAAREAGVRIRVGNLRRLRTLRWANRFIFQGSSKNPRHLANLNLSYLRPLGIDAQPAPEAMGELLAVRCPWSLDAETAGLLDPARFNLVIHPKSNKHGREWPPRYFEVLLELLPAPRFKMFFTGTEREREELLGQSPELLRRANVVDLMGRLDLAQFLAFLQRADGMLASGTGPLHIAGAMGLHTLGLFPGRHLINITRWRPLGYKAEALWVRTDCEPEPGRCPRNYQGEECPCMNDITPGMVAQRILNWRATRAAA